MFTHGFMSFAAIGITVACLLIMGTFSLVAVNANATLIKLEEENDVLAFVDESLTEEEARDLEDEILAVDNVTDATFISRTEALEDYESQYEDEELFQDLPDSTLRHRFVVSLADYNRLMGENGGRMETGRQADLITIEWNRPHLYPTGSLVNTLLECVTAGDVCDTVAGGKVLMKDRQVLTLDEEKIMAEAAAFAERTGAGL